MFHDSLRSHTSSFLRYPIGCIFNYIQCGRGLHKLIRETRITGGHLSGWIPRSTLSPSPMQYTLILQRFIQLQHEFKFQNSIPRSGPDEYESPWTYVLNKIPLSAVPFHLKLCELKRQVICPFHAKYRMVGTAEAKCYECSCPERRKGHNTWSTAIRKPDGAKFKNSLIRTHFYSYKEMVLYISSLRALASSIWVFLSFL